MPRKEKTNAKTWERERRNRMNLYFKGLADLLPPHQDGKNRNKVDILIQASKYIRDLTNRTEELFHAHAVDAHKEELNRLKKLVGQLYSRTQLLSTLLKDAGITVPAEPALEKITPLKWSNKINVEDAEKYLDRFKERKTEKRKTKSIAIKTPSKKKLKNGTVSTLTKKSATDKELTDSIKNGPAEDQENHVNSSINNKNGEDKSLDPNDRIISKTNSISVSDKESSKPTGPNLRTGVRKLQSRKKIKRKRTKSHDDGSLSKETLCKVTKYQPHHATQSQSIASLIPGTLILSGVSKIMPLVTPMTSNIIVNGTTQSGNSIILGNAPSNPMIVMQPLVNRIQNTTVVSVQNEIASINAATAAAAKTLQKVTLNTVPSIQTNVGLDSRDWVSNVKTIIDATRIGGRKGILPKGNEITKTTMAYKVPIPAVHRDGKSNNRNFESTIETKKSVDIRSKIKKLKPVKNKKLAEIKNSDRESMQSRGTNTHVESISCDAVTSITENCSKKRKNIDDTSDVASETPPMKIHKKSLPETCKSIESLRHVVEKIGDNSTEASGTVVADQQKNSDGEKYEVKAINTDAILERVKIIAPQSRIDGLISNSDVKKNSIEVQNSFPEKMMETTSSFRDMNNIGVSMNTSSKSCQVSDASFTSQNQSTITKSTDTLPAPSPSTTTTVTPTTSVSSPQHFPDIGAVISESQVDVKEIKEVPHVKSGFHNLISSESTQEATLETPAIVDNTKIILNLDTNTTTTMKPEPNNITSSTSPIGISEVMSKNNDKDKARAPKMSLSYSIQNSFIPIGSRTEALHSDLSNDLFASLQVPSSSHNPESISPTAAFLMAFPLVSSLNGKTEVLEEDMKEDLKYHSQTPPMLLQIGTIEPNSFRVKQPTDNNENKCMTEKNSKTESCLRVNVSTGVKIVNEVPSKVLPKIVNTETFKERLYKVVPYTTPLKKLPESPSSCAINIPTSSNACENREEKILHKPNTALCTTLGKYDDAPSSSMSEIPVLTPMSNELSKYNANLRHPSIPDYLPSYSTLAACTSENQMLPSTNSIVPSYSSSQIPSSQGCSVSSIVKDVPQTPRHTTFMNISPSSIPSKENESIGNLQTTVTTDHQEYQPRTSDSELSIVQQPPPPPPSSSAPPLPPPTSSSSSSPPPPPPPSLLSTSSSSLSLQYNYSSRPKETCSIQVQRNNHTVYPEQRNKNDPLCLMSTQSVNNNGSYATHEKESVNQIPYQAFPIVQKNKSLNGNDTSNQLIRTSSSSYMPPRTVDSSATKFTENKDANTNSYQSYLPFGPSKDSPLSTIQHQQQHSNEIQAQKLGRSYPTQVKQIQSNDSFDNIQQQQQQQRNYATARKPDTFASTHSSDQRTKSLSDNINKSQNQQDNNTQQRIETLYQTKRNDTQPYIPYSREQKKIFDMNTSNNSQITQSHGLNATLPRYQVQQQHQQSCVSTTNYSQSNVTENMAKTTTTVANNSSNFSILSWTTFSPICGSSSININNNNNNNNTNNNNTNNNNSNSTNNNDNNNIIQFEPVAEHVDDTQGHKICDNYNYNTLHKDNIGYVNLMASEATFTAVTATISGSNVDKSKNKSNHKPETAFNDATSNKAKNSVQSSITPQQQQQQQQQRQQQKAPRTLSQNPNVSDNFKFSGNEHNNNNEKNKSKFPMDTAYTQTEFTAVDHHSRNQHTSKNHQSITSKAGKSATYAIAGFDSQVSFDIGDTIPQSKCTTDIYSGNFKYPGNKEQPAQIKYQPIVQSQPAIIQQDSAPYNSTKPNLSLQQIINNNSNNNNNNKIKPIIHQQTARAPVNWMMTPEIKHNSNITDIILPPIGKELEFCPNNIFSQTTSYNQTTSNQFYNNYDAAVSSSHTFPNVTTLQTDSRRIIDNFYNDDQQFSWSPTKNPPGTETMKTIEQQVVVPSTLPTLVGDLALGTNIPEKQNFLYNQMPSRSSNDLSKSTVKEKDTNVVSRDFQVMLNPQTGQQASQGGSFLSVSQLVEHEKEKTHHHQQQSQHTHHSQQQAPQIQARKPQRKSGNTSPRGGAKRQIEIRKQTGDQQLQSQQQTQSQVQHPIANTDDQKVPSTHGFTDQTYQQSQQQPMKYQQNDALWRNRNCKSNYTAEALIGANHTTIQDTNNTDKQLHTPTIKFSADFPQNKFPTSLSTSDIIMPTINYLPNPDDGNSYGQIMNQNFNHSTYTYSANSNIYPSTNFMTGIPNTPSSYPMMPLHDNPTDYLETNSFLLPSVGNITSTSKTPATITSSVGTRSASTAITVPANTKSHQQYSNSNVGKHQNCTDKRNSYSTVSKKSKRKSDTTMNNLDFSISGVTAPIEDYHPHPPPPPPHHHPAPPHPPPPSHHHHHHHHGHTTSFLATPHANTLYQNHPHTSSASVGLPMNANRTRGSSTANSNPVAMAHHPSGTSLTNFNLSTIFPEINDKVTGYKASNAIVPGLSQSSNHSTINYPQRANYTTNNTLGHAPQISESTQFTTNLPPPPASVLHYKAT